MTYEEAYTKIPAPCPGRNAIFYLSIVLWFARTAEGLLASLTNEGAEFYTKMHHHAILMLTHSDSLFVARDGVVEWIETR